MDIQYKIIKKKIKNAYIQIKDGEVLIKVPYRMTQKEVQNLINQKKEWIDKHLQKTRNENTDFNLLGKSYPIIEKTSQEDNAEFTGEQVVLYLKQNSEEKKQELLKQLYKEQAQKQYIITTQKMMEKTGLKPELWKIRDIHSAWGSCSSKKTITLSLNLIQKREEVIEYVVLHELCHLKHMNHSKEFWNLVESYMPEYKVYRNELKI